MSENTASVDDADVLVRLRGALGHLTLNRPRAINALSLDMVRHLTAALDAWRESPHVDTVLIDGAGDRGLCAGGDVRGLREQIIAGHPEATGEFFRAEYALNAAIAEYPVPIVALADGITMGGGIGLAGHARIRIVTERSRLAMPETRIGFTPDVGGSLLLARAPGRLGEYLALTGASMTAADALYAGFADHLVPTAHLPALAEALETRADPGSPSEIVLLFDDTPDDSPLERARGWIDDAFAAPTVSEIVDRLRAGDVPEAHATADTLDELSPTALTITLDAVRRARGLSLRDALEQEYRLVQWFATTQPDLAEGIRAQLVDKDRSPRWQPDTLDGLAPDLVDQAFSFAPAVPLWG
ncbi:MAG: 3-hydroxyisobutyryl-CoA hydrolase [Microbacterium sp.]|nr:3-hydroxyisobutyryl-CoA hydrolase [Microbacterium sp.]